MSQFLFFSGKGGVGKTSLAAATAVWHADAGQRTLIVTTDPASNLADVFTQPIGSEIRPIAAVPGLDALEIDPTAAAAAYREWVLQPLQAVLPAPVLAVVAEQLNSPCTEEIAAFDRFVACMDEPGYDVVVFDTAPTGHTLRLLQLPVDWSRHISAAEQGSGETCLGPVSLLTGAQARYERALALMRDTGQTRFLFVAHPEATPLGEVQRARAELEQIGILAAELIINGVLPPAAGDAPFVAALRQRQAAYLHRAATEAGLPIRQVPLLPAEVRGAAGLRRLARLVYAGEEPMDASPPVTAPEADRDMAAARSLLWQRIAPVQGQRVVLVAGKGGVGKTSVAAALGIGSAGRGRRTLVITTDPASHLAAAFGQVVGTEPVPVGGVPGLFTARIDPKAALAVYRERLLADARVTYTPDLVQVVAEQLDSPCTEEMAAFNAFLDCLLDGEERWDVIVFDTAPTGHTLRLLELPMQWERQIAGRAPDDDVRRRHQEAVAKLRDPARTTVGFVMYPEATPILEAARAAGELASLGIATGFAVVNLVLPAAAATSPYLAARRAMQQTHLREVAECFPPPMVVLPLLEAEVLGVGALRVLAHHLLGHEGAR